MIITITCNPAIDKSIDDSGISIDIGGKGINVSKTLNVLGQNSLLTGFMGKENKDLFLDYLKDYETHFIEVEGYVRTNTKKIIDGKLLEENENGPDVPLEKLNELKEYLKGFKNEICVISGSISKNVAVNYYQELITLLKSNGNYVILDASGDLLKYGIEASPDMIKPNGKEICELFNIDYDEELIVDKCLGLLNKSIKDIIVSLGENGALFICKDNVYKCPALDVDFISPLGAGDSMVAAYAYAIENKLSYEQTIKLCMAISAATVQTKGSNPPNINTIENKINDVIIRKY